MSALLHDVRRTATVRALTPVLIDSLGKDDLRKELARVPGLREQMERTIAERPVIKTATAAGARS